MHPHAFHRPAARLTSIPAVFALALVLAASCARPAPSIQPGDLIQIDELAAILADSSASQPALVHIGFEPLYRAAHIPGSRYVGAGSKPEGLTGVTQYLGTLPAEQTVVLYCGCCPWTDCPNVQPAFRVAKATGRSNIRVLYITGNLERDWVAKGLPIVKAGE
jgi:hypothetical protein